MNKYIYPISIEVYCPAMQFTKEVELAVTYCAPGDEFWIDDISLLSDSPDPLEKVLLETIKAQGDYDHLEQVIKGNIPELAA